MGTEVENLIRLAWHVGADGRPGTRDALMTLAVAESGADDAVLAERCRRVLVTRQPDHWFATSSTIGQALTRPKVAVALVKLRAMFPPVRVRHLLVKEGTRRGPFTENPPSITAILHDIARSKDYPQARPKVAATARSLPFPNATATRAHNPDPDGKLTVYYLTVLLAIAVLLENVLEPGPMGRESKAA